MILNEITPPVILRILRRIKVALKGNHSVYSATVYYSKETLPRSAGDVWSKPNWLMWVNEVMTEVLKKPSSNLSNLNIHKSSLLFAAVVASIVSRKGSVSIMDFGGGRGVFSPNR